VGVWEPVSPTTCSLLARQQCNPMPPYISDVSHFEGFSKDFLRFFLSKNHEKNCEKSTKFNKKLTKMLETIKNVPFCP
jgi:hypothetical protein